MTAGAAAQAAEVRKHTANGLKLLVIMNRIDISANKASDGLELVMQLQHVERNVRKA